MESELLTADEAMAIVSLRTDMHLEPELANQEWKTQKKIRNALASFGLLNPHEFHKTGLYVDIVGEGQGAGRSIGLRGDIDALPINEDRSDLDYASTVPGVMHACGHDVHGSVALGVAIALHRMRSDFAGRVRVFFQPAEEAEPLGGRSVAELKLLDGFDHAVGFHVRPEIPAGCFSALAGPVSKSADQFDLAFQGQMAHASRPHDGIDAISIAAAFVNEVQKVVSREMPSDDETVVSIGTIQGGGASNIVCDEVVLTGTIRTTSPDRRTILVERVKAIAEGVAALHQGRCIFNSQMGEPPIVNDGGMVDRFRELVVETVGSDKFVDPPAMAGSDDFGFYSEAVPALYYWIGTREKNNTTGIHTPTFGVSNELLAPATELAVLYCLDLLKN